MFYKSRRYLSSRLLLPLSRDDAGGPRESVIVVLVTHHGEVGVLAAGVAHVTRQQVQTVLVSWDRLST